MRATPPARPPSNRQPQLADLLLDPLCGLQRIGRVCPRDALAQSVEPARRPQQVGAQHDAGDLLAPEFLERAHRIRGNGGTGIPARVDRDEGSGSGRRPIGQRLRRRGLPRGSDLGEPLDDMRDQTAILPARETGQQSVQPSLGIGTRLSAGRPCHERAPAPDQRRHEHRSGPGRHEQERRQKTQQPPGPREQPIRMHGQSPYAASGR